MKPSLQTKANLSGTSINDVPFAAEAASTTVVIDPALIETPAPPPVRASAATAEGDWRESLAEELLKVFDPPVQQLLKEVAYLSQNVPLWAVLAGCVQRCYEDGTLSAPVLTSTMRDSLRGWTTPWIANESTCEGCSTKFKPVRYGQRFHSTPCGLAYQARLGVA